MAASANYGDRSGGGIVPDNTHLLDQLRAIVGRGHVLTSEGGTRRYRTGFRLGTGPALAVVRLGSLVEQWRVLKACAAANKIIIGDGVGSA
jgi:D-lactate dehydrogenase (quinone)